MKILIAYASREGHTRHIARTIADRLVDMGYGVELLHVGDAGDIDLARFDGAILASPIHVGHYRKELAEFAAERVHGLEKLPTLFLSVSLAASGHEAEDWVSLDSILTNFTEATGWTPGEVVQVAGAYKPSEYDVVRRLIMRRIVASRDPNRDLDIDHVYTDWAALEGTVDSWLEALRSEQVA